MRALFFILLFGNLGLFSWQWLSASATATTQINPGNVTKTLVLLSERDAIDQQAIRAEESVATVAGVDESFIDAAPVVAASAALTVCYTLGPFKNIDLLERARTELDHLALQPSQRERHEREQYGYQVYLPAYPSRQAAIDAVRSLSAKGVREYYVMTDAGFENAISLGLFRDKQHADRHVADLKSKGIKPEMISRYRELTLYWLDYLDSDQVLDMDQIHSLVANESVQRLPRACT